MKSQPESFFPFERLLAGLSEAGVDFVVVGGLAISLNGYVRSTEDVDILIRNTSGNVDKLLGFLRQWGEGWARDLRLEDFVDEEGAIRVIEDFPLDIFTRMRGKVFDDFRPTFRFLEISGARIPFLGPADLISLKESSWRDKDQLDVHAMREILEREKGKPPESE